MPIKNIKMLIVEAEAKITRFLQMELEYEEFTTAIESNGRKAFDRIMQEDFDLALDVMLPEMDGVEVCLRVTGTVSIPLIFRGITSIITKCNHWKNLYKYIA